MPSIAPIVLAASGSVDKTYIPTDCTSALARWADLTQVVPIGRAEVTLSVSENVNTFTVRGKVSVPILEQPSGGTGEGFVAAPKVADTMIGKIEFVLPKRTDLVKRQELQSQLAALALNAFITAAVENQNRPY